MGQSRPIPDTTHIMPSSRFTWTRPTTHIYSYNREAQNILSERSRASSVTASASSSASMSRTARAASVIESGDHFKGYTGFYGKRLQEAMQTKGPTAAEAIYPSKGAAFSASASASASASKTSISASSTSIAQSKTTTTTEKTSSVKFDSAMEQQRSIEYGKQSKSRALRRAELHAVHSGKDPRHTV